MTPKTHLATPWGVLTHRLETTVLNQIINLQEDQWSRVESSSLAPSCGVLVEEAYLVLGHLLTCHSEKVSTSTLKSGS